MSVSFDAYRMEIFKSSNPVYYPNVGGNVWNDFKDNKIGFFNLVIPKTDDVNFLTTYDSQIGSGWNNVIYNYLLGTITDKGQLMNSLVPWGYCGMIASLENYSYPAYTAIGRSLSYFSSIKNIYEILRNGGIADSSLEYFAMSPLGSNLYILAYRVTEAVAQQISSAVGVFTVFSVYDKTTNTSLSTYTFPTFSYVGTDSPDGKIVVHFPGGYCEVFIDGRPSYEGPYVSAYPQIRFDQTESDGTTLLFSGAVQLNPDNPYQPIPQPEPPPAPIPDGEFDFHSDPVPVPTLPTISAADTGFTRLFNPNLSQLNALASYMWTDNTFWTTLKNKFLQMLEDPMKYIISLNLVPVAVPNGQDIPVKLLFITTPVSMPPVTNQFVAVDCGTYLVKRNYGSALDFAPNTKVSIYLPYIGVVPLDIDEIMPSPPSTETVLGVRYVVDVFSGTCVAMVTVNGDVKYQFSGHCAIGIPFASADFSTYQGALIQAAKTVVGAVAAGAGNPALGAAILGAPVQKTGESGTLTYKYDEEGSVKGRTETAHSSTTKAQFGSLLAHNITNTVSQVASSKPIIERSAGFSGNSGYLAVRRPYLIFESPRLVNPDEYGAYNGYPCMMYLPFANLTGFTQVQQIQLVGFSGTNPEIDELLALLKSGVIF